MSNMVLILILFSGVAAIFAVGSLVGHLFKLNRRYDEMMDKGGNIPTGDPLQDSQKPTYLNKGS